MCGFRQEPRAGADQSVPWSVPGKLGMPIVVSGTGPESFTQEEIEERRRARLAKKPAIQKKKKKKRLSVTASMNSDVQKLNSGIERKLIKVVLTPHPSVSGKWPGAPPGIQVVVPGELGHSAYIFQIKDRLKNSGFQWSPEPKLWWRDGGDDLKIEK